MGDCAAALAERGASAAARAHHVEYSARPGDPAAIALLSEAAGAAAVRAPASAARWFGAAARLLPDDALPEQRVGLLLARGQALAATGRLEESREAVLESLAVVPPEAVTMRVQLTVVAAGNEHMLGRYADARARLEVALAELPEQASPEAVSLRVVLAFDALFRADLKEMREAAAEALELAESVGEPPLLAMAAAVLALACAWGGEIEAAEGPRARAAELIDAMSDDELAGRIDACAHLAAAELYLDRYREAEAHAERALAVARSTGQQFPTLVPTFATACFIGGRLGDATDAIEGAVEGARLANNAQDLAWRLHVRSSVALASGDLDTAREAAREAVELTSDFEGESFVTAYPGFGLAAALLASGDPAGAEEVLVERGGGEDLPLIPGVWRVAALELLTSCRLELGRLDEAGSAADAAEAAAGELGLAMAGAWANRAAGAVALAGADPATAVDRAREATAAADAAGSPIEAALSRVRLGEALGALGDRETAESELRRAATELDDCGATRYRDAAERELRKQGHRIHRQTRGGEKGATGVGFADRAGARGRPAGRRPQDQRGDRRRTLPERQDRGDPHAQPLPQAGRFLARRGGQGGRTGGPRPGSLRARFRVRPRWAGRRRLAMIAAWARTIIDWARH